MNTIQDKTIKGRVTRNFDEMQAGLDYMHVSAVLPETENSDQPCNDQKTCRAIDHVAIVINCDQRSGLCLENTDLIHLIY